jgi:hypothetical protein
MTKPVKREPKKPYTKPTFIVYGTVPELRRQAGTNGSGDCRR